jgi:hypothetical protein
VDRLRALNDDDVAFERWFGPWTPLTPTGVAGLLADVAAPWWVVGGWAIEAFTGRPREHHDIDVGFFRGDLAAMLEQLAPSVCVWSNASGTLRPLLHPDELLPDCRQLWVRRDGSSPWILDLAMTPHEGSTWISPLDPAIRVPLDEAVFTASDGIRYLRPEIVLAFKAHGNRPQDRADLDTVLPMLEPGSRAALRAAVERVDPAHPWLGRIDR